MIIEYEIREEEIFSGINDFRRFYPYANILFIDGKKYVDTCDWCSKVILEPEPNYGVDCGLCQECYQNGNYYTDEHDAWAV